MGIRKCDRPGCVAEHYFAVEPISVGVVANGSSRRMAAEEILGKHNIRG